MKSFKRQFIEKYFNEYEHDYKHWDNLTEELLAAIEKDDGWIKIEEGCMMPESFDNVLTVHTEAGAVAMGYYDDERKCWYEENTQEKYKLLITHWRELPNTPKS